MITLRGTASVLVQVILTRDEAVGLIADATGHAPDPGYTDRQLGELLASLANDDADSALSERLSEDAAAAAAPGGIDDWHLVDANGEPV